MTFPLSATCEQLRDFFDWHVQCGYGTHTVMLDRRGLEYLVQPEKVGKDIGLTLPTEGESANPEQHIIYLRAAFA